MEQNEAIQALGALAQKTRLALFRHLVRAEPDGLAAGDLARLVDAPASTISAHLAALSRAGLVSFEREGRVVRYRAVADRLSDLLIFLAADCCGGRPEICAPVTRALGQAKICC